MSIVKSYLFKRNFYNIIRPVIRRCSEMRERKEPVKFSTSEAANWRAEFTRKGAYDDSPEIQPYVVSLSTAVFLWYFLWFREESDIDENIDLSANLYDKVDGLEEVQLKVVRENMLNKGEDVREIDRRLTELQSIRLSKESAKDTLA